MMESACRPRYATKRDRRRKSHLDDLVAVAELLGYDLMPWQRDLFAVSTEYRVRGGEFFYPTSVTTVPRQAGKSVMAKVLCAWRCMAWPDQTVLYIAQTRGHAAKHVEALAKDLKRAKVQGFRYTRGVGQEMIRFENGSTIYVESPNASGGHGASTSLVVIDEAFTLEPYTAQGIIPTLLAEPRSQLWIISTQGTEDSVAWNGFVERGREAVGDRKAEISYLEYAADIEGGDDVLNPKHWPRWMPSLGITITERSMRLAIENTMTAEGPLGVLRAYGNVVTSTESELFGAGWWSDTFDPYQKPGTDVVYAFDVNSSPAGASIAAAFPTEKGWHVDLVAYEGGESVLWIARELKALIAKRRPLAVATAGGGPARAIMPELEQYCDARMIPFRSMSVQDLGAAAGMLYEGLRTRSLSHGQSESLDIAAERAKAKQTGDLWRFDRKDTRVDVSPLVAASVALFAGQEYAAKAPRPAFYFGG